MNLPVAPFRPPDPLYTGADALVHGLIGRWTRRPSCSRPWRQSIQLLEASAPDIRQLLDQQLRQHIKDLAPQFRRFRGNVRLSILTEAAGYLREIAHRRIGLRPFPVQMTAVLALQDGFLTEMATGEGKTLVAGLAAALAGLSGLPCHVITVNDYLVTRDAARLKPLFDFCGLSIGHVTADMPPAARRQAYGCDITYVTSQEVLADFLRDRLAAGSLDNPSRRLIRQLQHPRIDTSGNLVMPRGLHTAIIDEADSVLIDEAVTPLIISQPRPNPALEEAVRRAGALAKHFDIEKDYRVQATYREIEILPAGREKLNRLASSLKGMWQGQTRRWELLRTALIARELYLPGKQYVIAEGKIVIVDEFTGRPMPQRTWRQGLHQAIEAKENLAITPPSETVARLSFQRFFRCYHRLAGMTGTAREAANEFWHIYQLPVVAIPTNRPCIRRQWPTLIFDSEDSKWDAIVRSIKEVHQTGRPILVGTRNVAASERLAERLQRAELNCEVLNATRIAEEAMIIAQAGRLNRITIATNMAGRGTDIELDEGVAALGGLHVIATECHESHRVDRQLFGRAARQGDPGSAQLFISPDDELFRRYARTLEKRFALSATSGRSAKNLLSAAILRRVQRRAETQAYRQRRRVLRTDDWLHDALSFTGDKAV